jgi:hypothetical protein
MATNITNTFASLYLTAHLPEKIYVGTDQPSIEVSIYVDSFKVFSSIYYPYNQVVCVQNIRSIVEDAMVEQQLDIALLQIEAMETDGSSSFVDDVKVIYSRFRTTLGSELFLAQNFLTTRKSALVPRNGQVNLNNYTQANTQGSNYALIYYSVPYIPGVALQYNNVMPKIQSSTERIVTVNLTHAYFKGIVDTAMSTDCKVLGVEYHIGSRQFNIFFTDEQPTETFHFLNAFNVSEIAYLYGTTTVKTDVSRNEAICGKRTQLYDETVTVKHEVETAPMTYDEAMWFSQLFTSKDVNRKTSDRMSAAVLISDITSEVTDSNKEMVKLKFSWKYAAGIEYTEDQNSDLFMNTLYGGQQ